MSKGLVEIYDTTLRDGTQGEGVSFSVADKLRVAERLDAFGVHYVEGGWPGSNPKDIEFFKQAAKYKWKHAQIAAFGSTRRKKVKAKDDPQVKLLIDAKTPVVTIFGKTWLLHVKEVLRTTPDENIAMIADTIAFLKKNGRKVIYDAEHALDGFKDDPEYAMATWKAAEAAGADFVVLCDTNGGTLPSEVATITATARAQLLRLIAQRRFNIMNGGWCQNDEANVHIDGIVDQHTLGHLFLRSVVGDVVTPRVVEAGGGQIVAAEGLVKHRRVGTISPRPHHNGRNIARPRPHG